MYILKNSKSIKDNECTLYHIQNMNIHSDGTPYNLFILSDHVPTDSEIELAFCDDYDTASGSCLADEIKTSSTVYQVIAHNI